MDFNSMSAKEICDLVSKHSRSITDDEWLELNAWLYNFLNSNPPEEEKKMFVPLGWGECIGMMCDGIRRWRRSICIRCKKSEAFREQAKKHLCEIYPGNEWHAVGIPNEIWAHENAECPYFIPTEK